MAVRAARLGWRGVGLGAGMPPTAWHRLGNSSALPGVVTEVFRPGRSGSGCRRGVVVAPSPEAFYRVVGAAVALEVGGMGRPAAACGMVSSISHGSRGRRSRPAAGQVSARTSRPTPSRPYPGSGWGVAGVDQRHQLRSASPRAVGEIEPVGATSRPRRGRAIRWPARRSCITTRQTSAVQPACTVMPRAASAQRCPAAAPPGVGAALGRSRADHGHTPWPPSLTACPGRGRRTTEQAALDVEDPVLVLADADLPFGRSLVRRRTASARPARRSHRPSRSRALVDRRPPPHVDRHHAYRPGPAPAASSIRSVRYTMV